MLLFPLPYSPGKSQNIINPTLRYSRAIPHDWMNHKAWWVVAFGIYHLLWALDVAQLLDFPDVVIFQLASQKFHLFSCFHKPPTQPLHPSPSLSTRDFVSCINEKMKTIRISITITHIYHLFTHIHIHVGICIFCSSAFLYWINCPSDFLWILFLFKASSKSMALLIVPSLPSSFIIHSS